MGVVAPGDSTHGQIHSRSHGTRDISADSLAGFVSDYNAVTDRFTRDGGATVQTLARWRSATGREAHSFVPNPTALYAGYTGGLNVG